MLYRKRFFLTKHPIKHGINYKIERDYKLRRVLRQNVVTYAFYGSLFGLSDDNFFLFFGTLSDTVNGKAIDLSCIYTFKSYMHGIFSEKILSRL